jgi:hypothetical protein
MAESDARDPAVWRCEGPEIHRTCASVLDEFTCFVYIFQMSVNKYRSPAKSHRSEAGNPSEHSEYF